MKEDENENEGEEEGGANQRARRVILAAVATGVAHVPDLGFVQVRELVLLGLRPEAQRVHVIDDLAQVVAALDLVLNLTENFAKLVFDRVRAAGLLLEPVQIRKELLVDEVAQVIPGHGLVVVQLAVLVLWRGPALPAVGRFKQVRILLAVQARFGRPVFFETVEVFRKEEP